MENRHGSGDHHVGIEPMTDRTTVPAPSRPVPTVAQRLDAPLRWQPSNTLTCSTTSPRSPTPRYRRGRRHALSTVLAVAVAAVLTGARSLAAIGEWTADAPGQVLAALGVHRDPLSGAFRPPGEATVRRVLTRIDADELDRAIGAWLAS
jgi:DDE_Tnp_1-associated